MKHARVAFLVIVIMAISMAVLPPTWYKAGEEIADLRLEQKEFETSYTPHSQIIITNDTEFYVQAEAEDWFGDGSEELPYEIDGYNITGDVNSIWIQDVSYHFIIKDCFINSSTRSFGYGIRFSNVTHGEIRSTTITWQNYGIYVGLSPNTVIGGCTIIDMYYQGIFVDDSENVTIDNCYIEDTEVYEGIVATGSDNLIVSNTDVTACDHEGIALVNCDFSSLTDNTVWSNGRSGIYLLGSANCTVSGNDVSGNSFSMMETGIHLDSSENCTIINNDLYENDGEGVFLWYSHNTEITGNDIYNNSDSGIEASSSENCTVRNNYIWENGFWPFLRGGWGGIVIGELSGWLIESNRIWNNSEYGIFFNNAQNCTANDNLIFNNTGEGIYGYWADGINVTNNDLWGNGYSPAVIINCGILVESSDHWLIQGNEIWNNSKSGIYIWGNSYSFGFSSIVDNVVYDSIEDGIVIDKCLNMTISGNTIYDNIHGLRLNCTNSSVVDNVVYHNDYGIGMKEGGDCWFYYNDLGWNTDENAYDVSGNNVNTWHDGSSIGNWWSDYGGVGSYPITAFVGAFHYDLYPRKSLDLNASAPLQYEITMTGNIMDWEAQARNPDILEVYMNSSLLYRAAWDGNDIVLGVDGLSAGTYNFMIVAFHVSGHSVDATSTLTVSDTTYPVWTITPSDQEINEGERLSYQVNATDPSGIAGWSVNDTANFHIDDTGLITNATTLVVGDYGLNISVWDEFGHIISRTIRIRVLYVPPPTTTPTTTTTTPPPITTTTPTDTTTPPPPVDGGTMLTIAAGGGAGAIIIIVVLMIRRREG